MARAVLIRIRWMAPMSKTFHMVWVLPPTTIHPLSRPKALHSLRLLRQVTPAHIWTTTFTLTEATWFYSSSWFSVTVFSNAVYRLAVAHDVVQNVQHAGKSAEIDTPIDVLQEDTGGGNGGMEPNVVVANLPQMRGMTWKGVATKEVGEDRQAMQAASLKTVRCMRKS